MKYVISLLFLYFYTCVKSQISPRHEPYGACCDINNGTCGECSQELCSLAGNIPQGDGTICANETCIQGACCFPNGECGVSSDEVCESADGGFQGFGIICEPDTCIESTQPPNDGACCFLDDECIEITLEECIITFNGKFLGIETFCNDNECPGQEDDDDDDGNGNTMGFVALGIISTVLFCGLLFTLLIPRTRTTVEVFGIERLSWKLK